VQYRGTWHWIDDGDIASKRVFTFLMLFFSLAETGVTPQAPVLTVPANRTCAKSIDGTKYGRGEKEARAYGSEAVRYPTSYAMQAMYL
jgi:hypothetical protein